MGSFWKKLFGTDAERRIQAAHRSGTLEFYLSRLGLRQLPPSIGQLTQPQELYVTSNQLTALPESLGQLTQLQKLDVSGNQLTALPETLKRLDRLQVLYLHDNPRLGLPPEVLGPALHEIIFKEAQPAKPASILEYYFRSRASRPLNEAKTSLVQRLVHSTFDPVEEPAARPREPVREVGTALKEAMRVVFSYAHEDEELCDQLETHLKLLQCQGVISTWHNREIKPGDEWKGVIDENFQRADLILLLVSADFVASDYCYEIEMKTALERYEKGEAKVVPMTSWLNRDEAWTDVAEGIKKTVEEIRRKRG
jgi:hypothetical protein